MNPRDYEVNADLRRRVTKVAKALDMSEADYLWELLAQKETALVLQAEVVEKLMERLQNMLALV